MNIDERLVFVDLETAGLDPATHPIIQIAAIAIDSSLNELESIEFKIRFDESTADRKSLGKDRYSPTLWKREALGPRVAAQKFARFLRRHASFDMQSKDGNPYRVSQLVAHNAERFDGPFLHAWYRRQAVYCPARYMVLCTKQRALWLFDEDKQLTPPSDFKLGTLCEYFGVTLRPENAHDALNDVRATVELYRAMRRRASQLEQAA